MKALRKATPRFFAMFAAGLLLGGSAFAQTYNNNLGYCSGALSAVYTGSVRPSGTTTSMVTISVMLTNNSGGPVNYQLTQPAATTNTRLLGPEVVSGTIASKKTAIPAMLASVNGLRHAEDGQAALAMLVRQVKVVCN